MKTDAILLALIVAGSAIAHHAGDCEPSTFTSPNMVTVDTMADGKYYVIDARDECHMGCLYNIWFYEETNGIDGLQRMDESIDNTCHGKIPSDTIAL